MHRCLCGSNEWRPACLQCLHGEHQGCAAAGWLAAGNLLVTSALPAPCPACRQVRREIFANINSSNWRLNGREAREKDVKELVRDKLKVQLENLCQVGAGTGGGCWLGNLCQVGAG